MCVRVFPDCLSPGGEEGAGEIAILEGHQGWIRAKKGEEVRGVRLIGGGYYNNHYFSVLYA